MLAQKFRVSFEAAANTVASRAEEINRLNVFPVPDGDTGTNMSLTLNSVVEELKKLPADAPLEDVCKAITHGSLMGARGNSGVITSQILRGLSEGFAEVDEEVTTKMLAQAFKRSVKVAFQAVRKPVEGTILTVLRDVADNTEKSNRAKLDLDTALENLVVEAFESVARTPDFLPVLKENGVVDAGGFGLAIFFEAFVAAITGKTDAPSLAVKEAEKAPVVAIELNDDWEGSEFTYCTEFLFHGTGLNEEETRDFLSTMGDCELLVGSEPDYKIHVHTDEPNLVLGYMLDRGQISEVHIHNMNLQAKDRTEKIAAEKSEKKEPPRPIGFVAVATGEGNASILESLGVDVVVRGGQTMNPSTKDLLDAVNKVNADAVIILPNNKNIIMAAQSAAQAADKPVGVVPTKSIPQSFTAMFVIDMTASLEDNVEAMTEALEEVQDAEITHAIKNSHAEDGTPIKEGDVIGIIDGKIDVVGSDVNEVAVRCVNLMQEREEGYTLTVLAGEDLSDEDFESLCASLEKAQPDLELDKHRGDQPLYPVILSIE